MELLETMHAEGKLAGKAAGVIRGGSSMSFAALLQRFGFSVTESDSDPIALGRTVGTARG